MESGEITSVVRLIAAEASDLGDFLTGLDQEGWSRDSACGEWMVGDVAAHLTQGAYNWASGITRAIAGDADPPQGQRALSPGERGSGATAQQAIDYWQRAGEEELLKSFTDGYRQLNQLLSGLGDEDWQKPCFHRRGIMPVHDYVALRLQELAIHGWDIRSAFDQDAGLAEQSLPALVGRVPRWLTNTFAADAGLGAPLRFRFDVAGPAPVRQDVVVNQDSFQLEPIADVPADITFRCGTSTYLLLIYGRLNQDRAVEAGKLEIDGNRELGVVFGSLFRGV